MGKTSLVFLILIACFSSCKINSIDEIPGIVAKINSNRSSYTRISIEDNSGKDLDCTVTGYYDGRETKLITSEYFAVMGRDYREYYFSGGELEYVRKQTFKYNEP